MKIFFNRWIFGNVTRKSVVVCLVHFARLANTLLKDEFGFASLLVIVISQQRKSGARFTKYLTIYHTIVVRLS